MSTTQYATTFRINPATAAKAFALLVDDGVLYKQRGVGMFVADGAPSGSAPPAGRLLRRRLAPVLERAALLGITADEIQRYIAGPAAAAPQTVQTPARRLRHDRFASLRRAVATSTAPPSAASTSTLAPGVVHGLLGRNGSGKTTLLSLLAAFRRPTQGRCSSTARTPSRTSGSSRAPASSGRAVTCSATRTSRQPRLRREMRPPFDRASPRSCSTSSRSRRAPRSSPALARQEVRVRRRPRPRDPRAADHPRRGVPRHGRAVRATGSTTRCSPTTSSTRARSCCPATSSASSTGLLEHVTSCTAAGSCSPTGADLLQAAGLDRHRGRGCGRRGGSRRPASTCSPGPCSAGPPR